MQSKIWNKMYNKCISSRNCSFEAFLNQYLNLGTECISYSEVIENSRQYDCIICGSDQIWNPLVYGYSDYHYLCFAGEKKRISYAPSIAKSNLSENELREISLKLKDFFAISVREEQSRQALLGYDQDLQIKTVLDPTFLISKSQWEKFAKVINEKYIFVYILSYNQIDTTIRKWINNLAKREHLKVIVLPYSERLFYEDRSWDLRFDVGPDEFLNLLINATYVVTNSFHATALSIINNKRFVVIGNEHKHETQSRIDNILDLFGLSDRYYKKELDIIEDIDYTAINALIKQKASEDGKWLLEAIEE